MIRQIKKVTVMKRFEFCYAHRLTMYKGKCSQFHGHNAILEVYVTGEPVDKTQVAEGSYNYSKDYIYNGMVIDFKELKTIVKEILEDFDHHNLSFNDKLGFDDGFPPTAENIARTLFIRIAHKIEERSKMYKNNDDIAESTFYLSKIRLSETSDSWVEIEERNS